MWIRLQGQDRLVNLQYFRSIEREGAAVIFYLRSDVSLVEHYDSIEEATARVSDLTELLTR